jgi:ADP-dependent NAD(P)H-hydrate dehydratase / NAD(P)H-hydrate epimerase
VIKILSSAQTKQLDQYTIGHESIAFIDLMERACRAFVDWFVQHYRQNKKIGIVCGTGNNGGDGLGIARLLVENHYPVKVWVVRGEVKETADFKINFERAKISRVSLSEISLPSDRGLFGGCDILIDAVFGSGLSRPVEGIYAQVIPCINDTNAIKIAVDIPSGLLADQPSIGSIVKAHRTISFQLPKLAFFFPENNQYVGEWNLVDIGLSKQFLKEAESKNFFVTKDAIKKILQPRSRFSHKGDYGHALLIAGSQGKMGACILAARAALRSGLGLLTVHVPKNGNDIVQAAVPEAMSVMDANENYFSYLPIDLNFDVIGIGPGLGKAPETVKAFSQLLEKYQKPMVLDADALNILSEHRELFSLIAAGSILTPHPKEFERLVGTWKNDFERLEKQKALSAQIKSMIVLKGAFTSIATPDGSVYFNSTGNPGMATGGSGDVLTGILTGLLAQGYSAIDAAILGVYLHGLSGDLAMADKDMNSLIASDLIEYLPKAFRGAHPA